MSNISRDMKKSEQRPILVTGAHRTGTTWVGKMLAASGQVGYISEPLNVLHRPGVLITPTRYWYTYICADNQNIFRPGLSKTLKYRYNLTAELASLKSIHDVGRMSRDFLSFQRSRALNYRPLVKDPFAFFSAPWFFEQFDCQVVITIRHPAAFVSSLKRLQWPFDLGDLLQQELLMRDFLEPYRSEIMDVCKDPNDVIGYNSLLWKIIYSIARDFGERYPQFLLIRHEDLSLQPIKGFESLYKSLDLDFTPHVSKTILSSTNSENPTELASGAVHSVQLNSKANLANWKHRLKKIEIARIRELTSEAAENFYPDMGWD
jgi:hypothetical protein